MKMFNVGRNTLRLYEDMGLLTDLKRTEKGYRTFSEAHLNHLKFIIKAKEVGFTLSEIKDIFRIFKAEQKLNCGTVANEISQKSVEIEK